ncbi:MAG: aminotransferase class V-fold PLP-dependent enzyme [Myxococcaceae bacterium]|nr:aminotransferase class V-fold PLP-dependent enzyme [Myxococcaceae bacterium]
MAPRPDALRPHYQRFLAPGRVLLTGHSHQAWPDVAWQGVERALEDAATHADDKWGPAFEAADAVRAAVARWVGGRPEQVALAINTHELVCRFLSALDLRARPHLVTTTGEFHSITRQLRRLDEQGLVQVTFVPAEPVATLADRLGAAVTERTAAVLASTVLFETSSVVPGLPALVARARGLGAEVLLDAYHAFGVLPFTLDTLGARDAFLVGGGYKYAQWGEGNCFLVVPPREFRPVLTGWFAGFGHLSQRQDGVGYGPSGAEAFAGSTYDPVSHYRARAVIEFFQAQGLTAEALREISLRQTQRLLDGLLGLELATPSAPEARAGFVAVRAPDAPALAKALAAGGILTDARGDRLRLGPAPYLLDAELDRGVEAVRRLLARRGGA